MLRVSATMRDWLRVIALEPGRLVYGLAPGFADDPAADLRDALLKATGERWQVERGEGEGAPTLREQGEAAKAAEADRVRRAPLVEAAFAAFPDAEIVDDEDTPKGDRNWNRRT
jgi:DNA polymerase-3 subunit gamma/tau